MTWEDTQKYYSMWKKKTEELDDTENHHIERERASPNYKMYEKYWKHWNEGAVGMCTSFLKLREKFQEGNFILAYYEDERKFAVESYKNIEKVDLKPCYNLHENPGAKLAKYMVNLKATQAFSSQKEGEADNVGKIETWFERFTQVLRDIFDDDTLRLDFDVESFQFTIHAAGREPFDFNTLSSGYGAVLDIVNDLIMRMEAQSKLRDCFDLEGIVLIDEIETHLHLELQKKIMPILTRLFPNIQFIVSTHSPFILNSLDHAVIYDLERRILVDHGMSNLPYEGIVEGYFEADRLSRELRQKFEEYESLAAKEKPTDAEYARIDELEFYLDEIPDYLAPELTAEYSMIKLELSGRE
ncbi:MAG: ATP-binding protein [Hungatella sp.]|nr:ATP-binding protein [Hungatella sp.]